MVKYGRTDRHVISGTPSRRTQRTTAANIIFCCALQLLTNMATGEDDIWFKTAIISLADTALRGTGVVSLFSMVTSTARLQYKFLSYTAYSTAYSM